MSTKDKKQRRAVREIKASYLWKNAGKAKLVRLSVPKSSGLRQNKAVRAFLDYMEAELEKVIIRDKDAIARGLSMGSVVILQDQSGIRVVDPWA